VELGNEYVVYEPNRRVGFTADSREARVEVTYLTEPAGTGTRATCRMRMEPHGLLAIARPLVAAGLRRDFRANFVALKTLLEQQH
jgi:hypothetical protein